MSLQALVLCSDDKILRVLRRVLSDLEIGVELCADADSAVRKLTRRRFEAVVVDCNDEDMAAQALKSVRSAPCNKRSIAVAMIDGQKAVRSAFALHAESARQRMASYYGNLAQTDDCVGQVLGALARLDLERNTIVLYLSDHGEMLGDLGLWNKFQFYEGSCGVPLMVRIPGASPAVCETPVSLISLSATLAELCSVPLPGPSDGRSFAGLISNPMSREAYGPVFAEFDLGRPGEKYMIRDGDLKYSFWVHDRAELYDLKNDPHEMRNLAGRPEYQATVKRMKERLFSWYRPPAAT